MTDNLYFEKIQGVGNELHLAEQIAAKFVEGRESFKYKKLADSAFSPMALSNRYGSLIYANKSYLEFVGADSLEEVAGNGWHNAISEDDRERVIQGFSKYISERFEKFWGFVKYKNLKTGICTTKKVVCSLIESNGYAVYLVPDNFAIDSEFIEAIYP